MASTNCPTIDTSSLGVRPLFNVSWTWARDDRSRDRAPFPAEVRISGAFYLGATPVTQAQYQAVTGTNPSHFDGLPENPVENVSWFEAAACCNALSGKEGLAPYYVIRNSNQAMVVGGGGYRLPTEARGSMRAVRGPRRGFPLG
jgi:formylglycine-generating enzyme required for sulfatase activity